MELENDGVSQVGRGKPVEKRNKLNANVRPSFDIATEQALPFRSTSDLKFVNTEKILAEKEHHEARIPQVNIKSYLLSSVEKTPPSRVLYHTPGLTQGKPVMQEFLHSKHLTYHER